MLLVRLGGRVHLADDLRVWKPARQQTGKSAVQKSANNFGMHRFKRRSATQTLFLPFPFRGLKPHGHPQAVAPRRKAGPAGNRCRRQLQMVQWQLLAIISGCWRQVHGRKMQLAVNQGFMTCFEGNNTKTQKSIGSHNSRNVPNNANSPNYPIIMCNPRCGRIRWRA